MVSCKDLELIADRWRLVVLVHFRESLEALEGGPPIAFDYQLRQGLATSTNALRLMEIMGLALPEED